MIKTITNNRLLLVFVIPLLLGSISVFSFQPFNITLINFLIFPSLFLILCNINKRSRNFYRKKPYYRNLFFVGYLFGIGFFLSGTYWISHSLTFDANFEKLIPITILLIPIVLGLFFGFTTILCGPFLKLDLKSVFIFCSAFSVTDYIRAKIFTGFPWNLWAYSWSWFNEIIQILNPIGLFAFNMLTISLFSLPVIVFLKGKKSFFSALALCTMLFFSNYLYGNYIINKNEIKISNITEKKNYTNVKIISPNFDLKYNLSNKELDERIKKLLRFSEPEKNKKTVFIWPEGALAGKYLKDIKKYQSIISKTFSDNHLIVLGINTKNQDDDKFFNSFVIINNKLENIFQYNKTKLVPFGEFLPLETYFENMGYKKITEGFGSFTKGNNNENFNYDNLNIIPLICYEIIFPELLQNKKLNNSFVINISEDGWFGNSVGPQQHFAKTIFRAIESNTYIARSANKGISAFVNNNGKIIKSLKNNESGSLEFKIPNIEKDYKNRNDLIFFVLLFTYGLIFLILKTYD